VDHHGCNTRDIDKIALDHRQNHAGCDARIDGIATALQDLEPGLSRQIVAG
jgi:hypothetical protein